MNDFLKKAKAVIIGHAIGDALGVPVEFRPREYLDEHPVTDMTGYGTYPLPKGTWSDDTAMSLCALESLSKSSDNLHGVMVNFRKWCNKGDFTATGETFDVGNTCAEAILLGYGLSDEFSNGNGSLMRINPFALFQFSEITARLTSHEQINRKSLEYFSPDYFEKRHLLYRHEDIGYIRMASSLTHAHPRSRCACTLYSFILWELLRNPCKQSVALGLKKATETYQSSHDYYYLRSGDIPDEYKDEEKEFKTFIRLFNGIEKLPREEIQSDGYVVHTLEAATWCLLTTNNYKDCVLKAVNLGNDTDTTAAVAGGLAGALYGYDAIPDEWKNALLRRDYIEKLCEDTFNK